MQDDNDEVNKRWKLTKEISVSNVLTIVGMMVGLFLWGHAIETRMVTLEAGQKNIESRIARQEQVADTLKNELLQRLSSLESKIDRLTYDSGYQNGRGNLGAGITRGNVGSHVGPDINR